MRCCAVEKTNRGEGFRWFTWIPASSHSKRRNSTPTDLTKVLLFYVLFGTCFE